MITFEIKSKSHGVFFVFLENKEGNKEIHDWKELLDAKSTFLNTSFFLESPWSFLWCWVRQQSNQWKCAAIGMLTICSPWCYSIKRKPHRRKTKGSWASLFCPLDFSNEQKHAEEIKQEKTNETMVILFAVSIKKRPH